MRTILVTGIRISESVGEDDQEYLLERIHDLTDEGILTDENMAILTAPYQNIGSESLFSYEDRNSIPRDWFTFSIVDEIFEWESVDGQD